MKIKEEVMEKIKGNMGLIEKCIYVLGVFALAFLNTNVLLYGAFLYTFVLELKNFIDNRKIISIIKIIMASIIIPNNYIVIAVIMLCYLLTARTKKTINHYALILLFVLIASIVINFNGIENVFFGLLYILPVFITFSFFDKFKEEVKEANSEIVKLTKTIIQLEIVSIIFYAIANIKFLLLGGNANDWLTGTFGYHQGNIFLYYMLFSLLILKKSYDQSKSKGDLIYIIISVILSILTNSISLILFFIVSYFLIIFFEANMKMKIINLGVFVVVLIVFLLLTPQWIKGYIIKLTNFDYFSNTVAKVQVYEDTFMNIPKDDMKFFIIGNGMGGYCSRAALTCTGRYVDFYNKFFKPSVTEYTSTYILGRYVKYNLEEGQGTLYSPFSTILSVQGEYGIIGTVLFLILIGTMMRKSNIYSKIFILFFFLSCFIENYLEFEKVMVLVSILYFLEQKEDMKSKKGEIE